MWALRSILKVIIHLQGWVKVHALPDHPMILYPWALSQVFSAEDSVERKRRVMVLAYTASTSHQKRKQVQPSRVGPIAMKVIRESSV